jgi:hypothetical protein
MLARVRKAAVALLALATVVAGTSCPAKPETCKAYCSGFTCPTGWKKMAETTTPKWKWKDQVVFDKHSCCVEKTCSTEYSADECGSGKKLDPAKAATKSTVANFGVTTCCKDKTQMCSGNKDAANNAVSGDCTGDKILFGSTDLAKLSYQGLTKLAACCTDKCSVHSAALCVATAGYSVNTANANSPAGNNDADRKKKCCTELKCSALDCSALNSKVAIPGKGDVWQGKHGTPEDTCCQIKSCEDYKCSNSAYMNKGVVAKPPGFDGFSILEKDKACCKKTCESEKNLLCKADRGYYYDESRFPTGSSGKTTSPPGFPADLATVVYSKTLAEACCLEAKCCGNSASSNKIPDSMDYTSKCPAGKSFKGTDEDLNGARRRTAWQVRNIDQNDAPVANCCQADRCGMEFTCSGKKDIVKLAMFGTTGNTNDVCCEQSCASSGVTVTCPANQRKKTKPETIRAGATPNTACCEPQMCAGNPSGTNPGDIECGKTNANHDLNKGKLVQGHDEATCCWQSCAKTIAALAGGACPTGKVSKYTTPAANHGTDENACCEAPKCKHEFNPSLSVTCSGDKDLNNNGVGTTQAACCVKSCAKVACNQGRTHIFNAEKIQVTNPADAVASELQCCMAGGKCTGNTHSIDDVNCAAQCDAGGDGDTDPCDNNYNDEDGNVKKWTHESDKCSQCCNGPSDPTTGRRRSVSAVSRGAFLSSAALVIMVVASRFC